MSLPDGVYGVGQIQVRSTDGNNIFSKSTFMESMIAPYRPAYPTFELIDNNKWLISMIIPTDHQATITSENLVVPLTFIGNSYHRIEFELEATTTSINVELTNGDISSTTTYKLPIQPPAITPSNDDLIDEDDVVIFLNVSDDELEQYQQDYIYQFSYDGGLNWLQVTSPDWRIELEDGIYTPGSLLFRFVVEQIDPDTSEILYQAYGPVTATFQLFVPYRAINLRAEELSGEPGGYTYKITGVGPISSTIYVSAFGGDAIMDSMGQFTIITVANEPVNSFNITTIRDYIQTGTDVTVIPQCSVESSRMIMGFSWNSITADSSTAPRPIITIIGLEPSVPYQILNIKSYDGAEATGTPAVVVPSVNPNPPFDSPPYSLSGFTDAGGVLRYVLQPDNNPSTMHPYVRLLLDQGVVSSIYGSAVISSKIITFEVEAIIDGVNRKFTDSLAYYVP